ncbi:hypothetical protein BDP27DRAFT_1328989 [Rhodocollybia butyracea]|uniref:Ubiquitin-like domain-containing protein n=1 Tax=Rhodocollybia butyracea TaxID=206335 RepID=A0A9P5PPV3_9AGAR|nr:hypothetical protein BDP27DRAFT_1328989 [Rhodocollybia butyracea]
MRYASLIPFLASLRSPTLLTHRFLSIVMEGIKAKLSAIRLWKKANRDCIPKYSIVASISTTISAVVPGLTTQDPGTHNPIIARSNNLNVVHQGLALLAPITAAIPIAGTPLKASIDTLLITLDRIETRGKNREDAARLTQRLRRLDDAISSALPASPSILQRRNELAGRLDKILGRLMQLHINSFLRSAEINHEILACIKEIDEHEHDYMLLTSMRMENNLQVLVGNQQQLYMSIQQDLVFVRDATGRKHKVLVDQCHSHEQFMTVLGACFMIGDANRNQVLLDFVGRGAYEFYIEEGTGITQLDRWSGVQAGTRIIMTAVFEQPRHRDQYKCPRPQCQAWNDCKEVKNGWIDCTGCPGRFQIGNSKRRNNKTNSRLGQHNAGSVSTLSDGNLLDLIQIYQIKQKDVCRFHFLTFLVNILCCSAIFHF